MAVIESFRARVDLVPVAGVGRLLMLCVVNNDKEGLYGKNSVIIQTHILRRCQTLNINRTYYNFTKVEKTTTKIDAVGN